MTAWMDDAACKGLPSEWFFPPPGRPTGPPEGLRMCGHCPVRAACLDYAQTHLLEGVWGGTTTHTRKRMRREAKR